MVVVVLVVILLLMGHLMFVGIMDVKLLLFSVVMVGFYLPVMVAGQVMAHMEVRSVEELFPEIYK